MVAALRIYQIAVPTPLYRLFDYLAPVVLAPGVRVRVPFGRRELVGVVMGEVTQSELPANRLKNITQALDDSAILAPSMLSLLQWAADYYHHPLGEVIHTALPVRLRQGHAPVASGVKLWSLTPAGKAVDPLTLKRAPAQKQLLEALATDADGLDAEQLAKVSQRSAAALKALRAKGWVSSHQREARPVISGDLQTAPELNPDQKSAVAGILAGSRRFSPLPAAWRHRQRQDRGLPERDRAGAGAGQAGAGAGAGDQPDTATGGTFRAAVSRAHRPAAFRPQRTGAPQRLGPGQRRPRAHRARHALGGIHAADASRPHRRGRGTRCLVQTAGRFPLFGPRRGRDARRARENTDHSRLGHAIAGEPQERAPGRLYPDRTAGAHRSCGHATGAAARHAPAQAQRRIIVAAARGARRQTGEGRAEHPVSQPPRLLPGVDVF
jgi:hypothetical protein